MSSRIVTQVGFFLQVDDFVAVEPLPLEAVRVGPYEMWTGKNLSDCVEGCVAR